MRTSIYCESASDPSLHYVGLLIRHINGAYLFRARRPEAMLLQVSCFEGRLTILKAKVISYTIKSVESAQC